MPAAEYLYILFLIGFLGSVHCVGMCGGFVMIARAKGGFPAYALGKTLTYVLMGILAGAVGHEVLQVSSSRTVVSVLTGLFLVVLGAGVTGIAPDRFATPGFLGRWLGPVLGRATKSASAWGTFGLGLVNGALPCGLVMAALMKSLDSGSLAGGAASMAAFGLGTLPALWAVSLVGDRFSGPIRQRLVKLGGWLVIALGIMTLWRGFSPMGPH